MERSKSVADSMFNQSFDLQWMSQNHVIFDHPFVTGVSLTCYATSFLIPPGEPYSYLEKMFLMFDWEVWVAIAVTIFNSLAAIQIINLTQR